MKTKDGQILDQSVQFIKSVGPKRAELFKKVGIESIRDMLMYFPSRHLDRSSTLTAAKAYGYVMNGYEGEITVIAKVFDKEKRTFGRREVFKVSFRDESGFFECVWFQGIKYFYDVFDEGDIFAVSGKPSISKFGQLQFVHPDFDRITEDESQNFLNTGKIIPFYRIPKELKEKNVGEFSLRRIISNAVELYADYFEESLPEEIISAHNLMPLKDAVKNMHFPASKQKYEAALQRFKFEEIFYLEILIALRKHNYKTKLAGHSMLIKSKLIKEFLKTLPFDLTAAQLKVLSEIRKDMEAPEPMNRLLQGDVGCGKTIVALIAMLIAVDNEFQTVLMAPTEILADQHAKNISNMVSRISIRKIKVTLIVGGQTKSEREKYLEEIEMQEADIIIGTHALFEEKVKFRNLALIVIDEQQRFGVEQRAKIIGKGVTPDVLVMSATPIPRTLSLTVYGDLDISVIDEMPKNRIPIKTFLRGENKLPEIYEFIKQKSKENYQAFVVYPLVAESEKLELKAAETYFNELKESYFKELNVGLLHGRMSWQEKEAIMFQFLQKKFEVLIATTVIEVGIDIPDANIMLINDAQRFGISQLHQLRGRIGRAFKQAYCILVTKDELAEANNKNKFDLEYLSPSQLEQYKAAIRLHTMIKYNDGFKIAEIDLKLRGPGDIFGTKQSGFPELKFIDLIKDVNVIVNAKRSAFKTIEDDPRLESFSHKPIRKNLLEHYSGSFKYAKIA